MPLIPRTDHDEERLATLISALPPAPEAWVRAAQELPAARAGLDEIVARAEADAVFRAIVLEDLEAALRAEGYEPASPLVDELRRRLST
jgi:hypothetical protein